MTNLYQPQSFGVNLVFSRQEIDAKRALHRVALEKRVFVDGRATDTVDTLATFYEGPGDDSSTVRSRAIVWARDNGFMVED